MPNQCCFFNNVPEISVVLKCYQTQPKLKVRWKKKMPHKLPGGWTRLSMVMGVESHLVFAPCRNLSPLWGGWCHCLWSWYSLFHSCFSLRSLALCTVMLFLFPSDRRAKNEWWREKESERLIDFCPALSWELDLGAAAAAPERGWGFFFSKNNAHIYTHGTKRAQGLLHWLSINLCERRVGPMAAALIRLRIYMDGAASFDPRGCWRGAGILSGILNPFLHFVLLSPAQVTWYSYEFVAALIFSI